jgi:hypothetical protein
MGRRDDALAVEQPFADEHGVVETGLCPRVFEAVRIAAPVAKPEWVLRDCRHRDRLEGAAVEEVGEARLRRHLHVVVGAGHHELVGLEVFVKDHLARLRALDPEVLRHLALRRQEAADLGPDDVIDPIHASGLLAPPASRPMSANGRS